MWCYGWKLSNIQLETSWQLKHHAVRYWHVDDLWWRVESSLKHHNRTVNFQCLLILYTVSNSDFNDTVELLFCSVDGISERLINKRKNWLYLNKQPTMKLDMWQGNWHFIKALYQGEQLTASSIWLVKNVSRCFTLCYIQPRFIFIYDIPQWTSATRGTMQQE